MNILHLQIGTMANNNKDKLIRNRQAKGEQILSSKLNEQKVKEILKNAKLGVPVLAEKFNISDSTVRSILQRKTWKHVLAGNYQTPFPSKDKKMKRAPNKSCMHTTTSTNHNKITETN